ncbi:MAG: (2Fe-2S) ferredoxin domain-containing protein [Chloroflexi bacterium]|nr:(2Fe-2S) ferredoxin domain-containing protein [Chloroflexota bacterium]
MYSNILVGETAPGFSPFSWGSFVKPYRKHVLVCTSSDCAEYGAEELLDVFKEELDRHGLDDVLLTKVGCVKVCEEGPIVIVYPEGIWYSRVDFRDVATIVAEHLKSNRVVPRLLYFALNKSEV